MQVFNYGSSAFSLGLVGRKATISGGIVKVDNFGLLKKMREYDKTLDAVNKQALGLAAYNARKYLAGAAKGTGVGGRESGNTPQRFRPVYRVLHPGKRPGGVFGNAGGKKSSSNSPYLVMSQGKESVSVTLRNRFVRTANRFQDGFPVSPNNKRLLMRYARLRGAIPRNLPWKNQRDLEKEGLMRRIPAVVLKDNPARPMFKPVQRYIKKTFRRDYERILQKKLEGKIATF